MRSPGCCRHSRRGSMRGRRTIPPDPTSVEAQSGGPVAVGDPAAPRLAPGEGIGGDVAGPHEAVGLARAEGAAADGAVTGIDGRGGDPDANGTADADGAPHGSDDG